MEMDKKFQKRSQKYIEWKAEMEKMSETIDLIPHFTDEDMEEQRSLGSCHKSHRQS